jgi:integrase
MGRRRFGSVRRLPSGRWQARYRDGTGYLFTAPGTFPTRREAERFLVRVESDMERGAWQDPRLGRITFGAWSAEDLANAAHKRATTLARDRVVLQTHLLPAFGARPLASITPRQVQRLVAAMAERLAPATVRTNYGVLRAVFAAAVDADLLVRSPCRGIKLPVAARHRPIRFLSPDELARLAAALPVEYRPMAYLSGVLGLRWSEVAGLRVGRIDLLRHTVTVAETLAEVDGVLVAADVKSRAGRRTLELPEFLAALLAEHLARRGLTAADPHALVFVGPGGTPLRAANFRTRVWAPALRGAGLDGEGLTFHHLRHSAVGFLIDANASLAVMQQRMGHASIRTTLDVYGHILPATDQAATAHLEALFGAGTGAENRAQNGGVSGTLVARPGREEGAG